MGDWDMKELALQTAENFNKTKEEQKEVDNWLLKTEKETVVIFGAPKIGKTYAYLSIIDTEYQKDKNTLFYIINTDGGLSRSFKEYFKEKSDEISKNIRCFYAMDIKEAIKSLEEIKKNIKEKDWIIMDLMSDFWDMAQEEFTKEVSGGDVTKLIINASKDSSKFGLFDSNKWSYIKYLDNQLTMILPTRPICNVVGVCAEKDLEVEEKRSANKGGTEMTKLYSGIGARPAGQKQIAYKFNTILYIDGITKKQITIFGDRGKLKLGTKFNYEKNMWQEFKKVRDEIK